MSWSIEKSGEIARDPGTRHNDVRSRVRPTRIRPCGGMGGGSSSAAKYSTDTAVSLFAADEVFAIGGVLRARAETPRRCSTWNISLSAKATGSQAAQGAVPGVLLRG